jgi:hypothetical protein
MTLTRKEILMAFANDQVVQVKEKDGYHDASLAFYTSNQERQYRIKPVTITVNGVECPPVAKSRHSHEQWLVELSFGPCYTGRRAPSKVFVFNTEADARQVFDALIKPFQGEQK